MIYFNNKNQAVKFSACKKHISGMPEIYC